MTTFILILHDGLLLHQLYIALICNFEFFEILIYLPQLVCVLLEPLIVPAVYIFNPSLLLLILELLHTLGHSLSHLLWSLLHVDDFLLIFLIFLPEELSQFLSTWVERYLLALRLRLDDWRREANRCLTWLLISMFFPLFCHLANSAWWNSCLSLVCIADTFCSAALRW
jgi:hypothetical protein